MSNRTHLIIMAIATLALTAVFDIFILNVQFVPVPAATQAAPIDFLFILMFCIAGFFLALSIVVLLYSMIFFRRRPGDEEDGPAMTGNVPLEVVWTIIPFAILMALAVYGTIALNDATQAQPNEMEVVVSAAQWSWQFEYPEYGIKTGELHLLKDRPVLLKLNSFDVVHSFWVPEFRVKQDAVPGMETQLRFTPNREGKYTLECAELCGLLHAYMVSPVEVEKEAEFTVWVQEHTPKASGS